MTGQNPEPGGCPTGIHLSDERISNRVVATFRSHRKLPWQHFAKSRASINRRAAELQSDGARLRKSFELVTMKQGSNNGIAQFC